MAADLRSNLGRVKGLGAAHHGTGHWWLQRVTAVALLPLSVWFVYSLVSTMLSPDVLKVAEWFSSPFNTLLMLLLVLAIFVHAKLGAQVVIEDYVKGPVAKYALLMMNVFICFGFAVISMLAVLKLHFLDVVSGGM